MSTAAAPHAGRLRPTLQGTLQLVRLDLRVDRVRAVIWVLGVVGLVLASGASVMSLYSTPADVAGYVSIMDISPNMLAVNRALNGPGFGFDDPNIGVVLVNEVAVWGAVAFAMMGVFLTARHTRGDEDAERTEILRSRMVGRHAVLAAAAITVGGLELVAAVLTLIGLLAMGFAPVGTLALVAAYLAAGLVFGALTALFAQIAGTSRATVGLGVGALGLAYLVRAIGDMGGGGLSWVSPIGWVHRVRAFAGEQWWVLALSVGVVAVASVGSLVLADRRNLGSGLAPQRPGPPHAGWWTVRPWGLIARLQVGSLTAWSLGLVVIGVAYGSIASDIEQMIADNPEVERFIALQGPSVTDAYLSYTLALSAMLVGGFATASVLRLRSEENDGILELVLAHPVARVRWAVWHLLVAGLGSTIALVASGLGTGAGVAFALGEPDQVLRLTGASLSLLPAVLVLVGVAMLCVGAVPKVSALAWAALAWVVVVGLFGELFRIPTWLRDLSPLEQLPRMPAAGFEPVEVAAVTAVAVLLAVVGLAAFRHRDVPTA